MARFDTAEIVLHSAAVYDGAQGSPNPFTDVELTAQVTSPGGKTYTVDGFFDGDGAGGQAGDVFKVRVFVDEAGTWSWATTGNAAGLDGQSGTIQVSGTLAGVFGQGPVEKNPARPRTFLYRTGKPAYLIAKYLDMAAPAAIRFSQTLLSELRTEADRQALLDRHLGMRMNKVNIYLANQTDYSGVSTTPWLGTASANDKARFNLARWHMYERWLLKLRDAGMAAQLWFFADGFGNLPDAERQRLIRYGMARLSGYTNTLFTLVTEWQEGWTTAEVEAHMNFLHQHNPWGRLASVHGVPGDFSFPTKSWADYLDIQVGVTSTITHSMVHDSTLRNRALAVKPTIQEEFFTGQETAAGRQMAWAAFTAGAAGTGTGAFLRHLADFVDTVPFERMSPADSLVLAGGAYALAEAGQSYVAYLYDGGSATLDLSGATGAFRVDWFDPRTGAFQSAPAVTAGAAHSFTAPADGDWVLRLTRESDTGGPTGDFHTLTPCRLIDTRSLPDGPALISSALRDFDLTGRCGVPDSAVALSLNVSVTQPTGSGHVRFSPGGIQPSNVGTIHFPPGASRANNALLPLASDGSGVLRAVAFVSDGGSVHLILDVNGYFE